MDKITKLPVEHLMCFNCEQLFDDGKYYISKLDYDKLKSSHEGLVEALKLAYKAIRLETESGNLPVSFQFTEKVLREALKAADGEGVK